MASKAKSTKKDMNQKDRMRAYVQVNILEKRKKKDVAELALALIDQSKQGKVTITPDTVMAVTSQTRKDAEHHARCVAQWLVNHADVRIVKPADAKSIHAVWGQAPITLDLTPLAS